MEKINPQIEIATLGAGCFWCVEAAFQSLEGVIKVVSGYAGGKIKNPTYKEVCSGLTEHAEVCQITFNPTLINFETLLQVFWKIHDPTTLNKQGNDIGTQYRSVIYYHTEEQKNIAQYYKNELNTLQVWKNPIVTEITAYSNFYAAEDYHQNYFNLNENQPYCQVVVRPKLENFKIAFKDKLKKQE